MFENLCVSCGNSLPSGKYSHLPICLARRKRRLMEQDEFEKEKRVRVRQTAQLVINQAVRDVVMALYRHNEAKIELLKYMT